MTNTSEGTGEKSIKCFAFGANADPEMLKAIIGNDFAPGVATKVEITGYELCYKTLAELDEGTIAKDVIAKTWDGQGRPFMSYFIRKALDEKGFQDHSKSVKGVVWTLTPQQYAKVQNWELAAYGEKTQETRELMAKGKADGTLPEGQGMQVEEEVKFDVITQVDISGKGKPFTDEDLSGNPVWPYYPEYLSQGGDEFKEFILAAARKAGKEFEDQRDGGQVFAEYLNRPFKVPFGR